MRARVFLRAGLAALLATAAVPIARAGQIGWSYQVVDSRPNQGGVVAMSIGEGAFWPKVFYNAGASEVFAASLSPAGWLPQNMGMCKGRLAMASEPGQNGRVGAVWIDDLSIQYVQSTTSGWARSTVTRLTGSHNETPPDMTWLPNNQPLVAYTDRNGAIKTATFNGSTWDTDTLIGSPDRVNSVSTAVDGENYVGVAFVSASSLYLAMKDFYSRDWQITRVGSVEGYASVSLAFGPDNQPLITYGGYGELRCAAFDVQTGVWQSTSIATDVVSGRPNLVFNKQGQPALAYSDGEAIHYRINDGNGWADYTLPTGPVYDSLGRMINRSPYGNYTPALAFDRNDVPLIAYHTSSGLVLAYDPVIPEPATVLLLPLGSLLLGLKRRAERRPA